MTGPRFVTPAPPASDSLHTAYRADIDGLRAVAVLSVLAYHAAPGRMPGGFVGVDIFFVISGFLITSIIDSALLRRRFSFLEFYERRVRRLFPALAAVLGTTLVAGCVLLTAEDLAVAGREVAAGAGFVANLALWQEAGYFDARAIFKPLLHLWSLGVEEQFYLLWPAVLLLASRLGGRRRATIALIAALAGLSFAWSVSRSAGDPAAAYYDPLSRFWEPFLGAGVAIAMRGRTALAGPRAAHGLALVGAGLIAAALVLIDDTRPFPGWWATLPTAGAALLIASGPTSFANARLLAWRPMVAIGLISYPLYLWHWPLLAFPRIIAGDEVAQWQRLAAVLLSFPLAWATWRYLERPVRASPLTGRGVALMVAAVALPGLAGLWAWQSGGWPSRPWSPAVVNAGEIGPAPFFRVVEARYRPCDPPALREAAQAGEIYLRCPQSMASPDQDIAIIGDSHAESLFPGLAEAMPGKNIVFYGIGTGLPFATNPDYDDVFRHVVASKSIATVVITAAWPRKLGAMKDLGWRQQLAETLGKLRRAGKEVLLADDVPAFSFLPARCKFAGMLGRPSQCVDADRAPDYSGELQAIARSSDSKFFSLHALFCADGRCRMAMDGALLFRDDNHLGLAGSRIAGRAIAKQIGPSLKSEGS